MTKNRITALQKSSFVKIQKEGKVYRIIHNVSGKQFVVDKKAIDVINLFDTPTTLEECNFDQLVENSIIYLVNNGVLVPTTNKKLP
jgi:hypothetical protein